MFRDLVSQMDDQVFPALGDPAVHKGETILGMFDAPWLEPEFGRQQTALRSPVFVVRDAVAAAIAPGDTLDLQIEGIDAGLYTVTKLEPDGTGLITLVLRRAK
ncbi:head-tail joining protein [Frateuria aurantia]|uniref:Uncharacterized protein n=1 Tax=Frateuria aurantia (strain ATCC 33424 / DSM 6220 / KCTC 2777 / LMG 1558 / NBRC 3245 / NCIMB 13370) TaxID=767434 RepID=H8L2J5_FRAAD|nr:hypothetical protein [Frateuria aurantia]AFC85462.1 hypothetical protein Fraau_0998 [Frateuria aurantia DSM 6220]